MRKNAQIYYFGTYGFPVGYAQIERQKLISKGLMAQGCDVTIISRYGIHADTSDAEILSTGNYEGIKFKYATGSPYRPQSFLKRNWQKIVGGINEFRMIRAKKRNGGLDYIILSTNYFYNIFIYRIFSKLTGVPLLLDTVEHWTSFSDSKDKNWFIRWDNKMYDNQSFNYVDKVLCISDFLMSHTEKLAPEKPKLKVPAMVDFSKFKAIKSIDEKYLLYCGHAAYWEVLFFILEAFEKIDNKDYFLYLVSHGNPEDMKRVKDRIAASPKKDRIKIFSKLPYSDLVDLYMSSKALLIPLRNSAQDIARFPHKTGEYTASSKVIVSTNIGELKNYFSDKENALLAKDYDVDQYAESLAYVVNNPDKAAEIGIRGHLVGKKEFDHLSLGKKIFDFMNA
ncbi:glycosyltransferase [Pollutibacter soli]|uniref:glycosyltransferase n=1 Tax=Pollutibacter soli TaxID=3034157 RepID=UPI0030140096